MTVGLYLSSLDKAVVLCVDERTQALKHKLPTLPVGFGHIDRSFTTTDAMGPRPCLQRRMWPLGRFLPSPKLATVTKGTSPFLRTCRAGRTGDN